MLFEIIVAVIFLTYSQKTIILLHFNNQCNVPFFLHAFSTQM